MEAQTRSPVVKHERDIRQAERLDKAFHVSVVVVESLCQIGLVGLAHADEVERNTAPVRNQVGRYIAQR